MTTIEELASTAVARATLLVDELSAFAAGLDQRDVDEAIGILFDPSRGGGNKPYDLEWHRRSAAMALLHAVSTIRALEALEG